MGNHLILLAASKKDQASMNITKKLLEGYPFKPCEETFKDAEIYALEKNGQNVRLAVLDGELIHAQTITDFSPSIELIIFLSRHSSEKGIPTLSVHTPGNLGKAEFGGITRKLSVAPANAMKTALKVMAQLAKEKVLAYKVSYECTHHGPSLDAPAMFVELGSTPKQWADMEAAKVIAHAAMETVANFKKREAQAAIGIGGPHYNEKFTKIALESNIAFGHIIPKYTIPEIDEEILSQCVQKTLEKVELALLDWKGIKGEDKQHVVEMLENLGLKIQKV
ncbi:MAG: D-aminoacyl-tRNA deacylase [Candidatus Bathyarchaeia archaeon]